VTTEVIDCEEFSVIRLRISDIVKDGELILDERISGRGYLSLSLAKGEIVLRTDKHVGMIPVTPSTSVRVRPRFPIANLTHMLVRSGVAPTAIPAFSRGYLPRFETGRDVEKIYGPSLADGVNRLLKQGLAKTYVPVENPPPWRGRLAISRTVTRHASKGVRYKHEFDQTELSRSTTENIALKAAVAKTLDWYLEHNRRDREVVGELQRAMTGLSGVSDWRGPISGLVSDLGRRLQRIPRQLGYYRDPLWTAFLILQKSLPDVGDDGSVTLDSLIVDMSLVFEAYVRRALFDRAYRRGWNVRDGNRRPSTFFVDNSDYTVHPDIVIFDGETPLAVLDAKYKPEPKENDRYEVLAFMEGVNVIKGGFICPTVDGEVSSFLGTTPSARQMSTLRFDMAADNPEVEADRLFDNVCKLIDGDHSYR